MAAKISKRSKKLPKVFKAAQRDEARRQKAIDKEVARALASSDQLPQSSGVSVFHHYAERQLNLPQHSDSRPNHSLSPDGAAELAFAGNLSRNRECLYASQPDPFSASTAWQQPIRPKISPTETASTPNVSEL